jgi:hypothetical protein
MKSGITMFDCGGDEEAEQINEKRKEAEDAGLNMSVEVSDVCV